MIRMWSVRLFVLGGLALALGCRSHQGPPSCSTPLLPGESISSPSPPTLGPPPKLVEAPTGAQLLTKPDLRLSAPITGIPAGRSPQTHIPETGLDIPTIKPPPDVKPLLNGQPVPGPAPREVGASAPLPVIKPLMIEAPRPPAGADGFAPASIIPFPVSPIATIPADVLKPASPLPAGEKFGHAADYKWIAGVLDKHQKGGYWTIRYADASEDDPWGGKVRLLSDERLARFDSGDVVYLEGELLALRGGSDGTQYPPFRITAVRLVEKGR